MTEPGQDDRRAPATPNSRRQRAPTITIDTSAVSPPLAEEAGHPMIVLSNRPQALHEDQIDGENEGLDARTVVSDTSPVDLRPSQSSESRESRPTSPHNISSPKTNWNDRKPQNFLAVPLTRSRHNSVDSDDGVLSPTSFGGDTVIPSPGSSQNGGSSRNLSTANSSDPLIDNEDALKADPGNESYFEVPDNRFAFSPGQLGKLLNPKSLAAFNSLGGLRGLEKGLRTDRFNGLSLDERKLDGTVSFEDATTIDNAEYEPKGPLRSQTMTRTITAGNSFVQAEDSFYDRRRIFRDNLLPEKKAKGFLELAWLAYNDKVLILLSVAAVISLALGIYQSVTATNGEARVQWVEGVAIMVAIIIVVVVGAANDWQKERQFVKLNHKKEDRVVKLIRSGKSREISVHDVLVGDVMHLEPGDIIPVDGIFISGHNLHCDESSATGESDLLRKTAADEVYRAIQARESVAKLDPFVISGGKITEGIGTFLVTAVGVNSSHGKTMMSLREDAQTTPLQTKLNALAEYIAKLGLGAGLILFVVTFIEFLVRLSSISGGASAKGQAFLNVFIVAVTIIVVAVPEGLPLAVTLALAFATTKMLKENNLVRVLRACETMGNATDICSDKTGTLTQNKMLVVAGTFSTDSRFGEKKIDSGDSPISPTTAQNSNSPSKGRQSDTAIITDNSSTVTYISTLYDGIKNLLKESIVFNSTAFEGESDGQEIFIGSKTETALLQFARDHLGMEALNDERLAFDVVQLVPFDSGRKCMATAVKLGEEKYRLYIKGASELMLEKCDKIIRNPTKDLTETAITPEDLDILQRVITSYGSRSLRTIGLLYKDFKQWPPKGYATQTDDPKLVIFDSIFKEMVWIGIIGIQDPLRPGVTDAVRACQKAGVTVRMVTGDNILTAKAIAEECGIYTPGENEGEGGIAMEGPVFRRLTRQQMNQTIPKLQVLARSSPEDKRILVKRLKDMGQTVAVTGDGTNDAPALKTADVGFSMGIAGTEVAKEASAIILMDDNFASIVKAMMWGRAVNDSVKKFLQFQVTVNITAVVLTFISAVGSSTETSVLTAVQLLWVNLIMDTFAALALATDPPTPSILNRNPEKKSAPLITLTMWKMIVGQSIFQLVVTLILYFAGPAILNYSRADLGTLIFNTFVWMQIFNQYNCRRLDNGFNIFEGMFRNYFFIGIQFIIVAGQLIIIFVGGAAFSVRRLNGIQWGISVVLGLLSIPVALIIRLIPDSLIEKLIPNFLQRKAMPELVISDEEAQHHRWNPALEEIRDELTFLKMVRGGRLNMLKYKIQHPSEIFTRSRSASRSRESSVPQTPNGELVNDGGNGSPGPPTPDSRISMARRRGRSRSNSAFGPAAAMAGIIAGSIGGGWSPLPREGNGDGYPGFGQAGAQEGVEMHPDLKTSDSSATAGPSTEAPKPRSHTFGQQLVPPPFDGQGSPGKGHKSHAST